MSPDSQAIEFRNNEDLAVRAREGVWGHPVCLTLVCFTSTFVADHPVVIATAVFLFLTQTILRIQLLRSVPAGGDARCEAWRFRLLSLLVLSGAIWGVLAGWSCYVYGYHHANTLQLLLYHAAVAVVGTPVFVHDLKLTRFYLVLLFVPPILVHVLFPDTQHWAPAFALSCYAVFLSARAAKLHAQYLMHQSENRDLRAVAGSDPLTGLPNRLSMLRNLEHAIGSARAAGRKVAVLFIDLDGFKAINDRYSHRAGDLFLCEIAKRLALCGGSPDSVSRLGGDEFTLLLAEGAMLDSQLARTVARDVLDAARRPVMIEGQRCAVSASIGIGFFPDDADTGEELLRAADHAMYEAKRTGANQVCFAGTRKNIMQSGAM